MHNQIIENILSNNNQLKKIYNKEKDYLYYFLFLFYTFNKDKTNESISFSFFKRKINQNIDKRYAVKISSYSLAFNTNFESIFNESYRKLFSYDLNDIKNSIIEYIIFELFNKNDDTYEMIERSLFSSDLGDCLVISNNPKKYLFNLNGNISSVTYNFYIDRLNSLSAIFFDINNYNYKIFDLNNILIDTDSKYDNIFYCLPYNKQGILFEIQKLYSNKKGSLELESVRDLHDHLKNNGNLIMLLPTGILNNIRDFKLKKYFVDNGFINLVVELPKISISQLPMSGIFFSHENKKVLVSNATKYAFNNKREMSVNSEKLLRAITGEVEGALLEMDLNYIKENKYDLTPHRYTDKKHYDFINPTKLKDLTKSIFRGYQISSEMLSEYQSSLPTKIKLLTLSCIEDGEINKKELQSLTDVDKAMKHYILMNNDLVISCKGKSFKTAVVEIPRGETYISTGSIIVIRVNEELIDPMYLKIFLDSTIGNNALKNIQTGSQVLSLNPTKLLNIEVPLVDIMKQQQIASSYRYKLSNIKEVKEVMESMEKDMFKKFDDDFLDLLQ